MAGYREVSLEEYLARREQIREQIAFPNWEQQPEDLVFPPEMSAEIRAQIRQKLSPKHCDACGSCAGPLALLAGERLCTGCWRRERARLEGRLSSIKNLSGTRPKSVTPRDEIDYHGYGLTLPNRADKRPRDVRADY